MNQLKRLDRSIESVDVLTKGKFDEYGQAYEFGDEFAGLFGFRSVNVNPARTLDFKVADYQRGVRESRSIIYKRSITWWTNRTKRCCRFIHKCKQIFVWCKTRI